MYSEFDKFKSIRRYRSLADSLINTIKANRVKIACCSRIADNPKSTVTQKKTAEDRKKKLVSENVRHLNSLNVLLRKELSKKDASVRKIEYRDRPDGIHIRAATDQLMT